MTSHQTGGLGESVDSVSVGRVYDYLLGGVHNYPADRAFAEQQAQHVPDIREFARANRAFLGRAVRYAVASGIHQFVDIGSGLPTQGNVHEIADEVAPGQCRVVYVDHEPIAHAQAEVLLEKTADPRRHRALDADFFDGRRLWHRVLDTGLIDPNEPVALLAVALLHFMPRATEPDDTLRYYRDRLAPGSLLALSHVHVDPGDTAMRAAAQQVEDSYREQANNPAMTRERGDIAGFFGELELVEPGLVWLPEWRPDGDETYREAPHRSHALAGVARKP